MKYKTNAITKGLLSGLLLCLAFVLSGCPSSSSNDPVPTTASAYQLTTSFTGDRPLGIELDGSGVAQPVIVAPGSSGAISWNFTSQGNDLYRISAHDTTGNTVLAVQINGDSASVVLVPSSGGGNDIWQVTPLDNGSCRITAQILGQGSSLDIVNDDDDRLLMMGVSSDASGQSWQLEKTIQGADDALLAQCTGITSNQSAQNSSEFEPTENYRRISIRGFTVLINPSVDAEPQMASDALAAIDDQLAIFESELSVSVFSDLQKVFIWVERDQRPDSAGQFHTSAVWLQSNGYNTDKAGAVEISNTTIFIDRSQNQISSALIHELAHARLFYVDEQPAALEATYQQALLSTNYNSVALADGSMQEAYAMTNSDEYIAELSEAYFAINDFYPFNRTQLQEFDPDGYDLIAELWELD